MFVSNLLLKCRAFVLLSYILILNIIFRSRVLNYKFKRYPMHKEIIKLFKQYLRLIIFNIRYIKDPLIISVAENPIGNIFSILIGTAWFCEKLNIRMYVNNIVFENTVFKSHNKFRKKFRKTREITQFFAWFPRSMISSEYGNKVISQLGIRKDIQQKADNWTHHNLQGDFIGIHYRGTDAKEIVTDRYMTIDSYIIYLKEVLGENCNIFACSDQEQFIKRFHAAFPGQVVSRDITRSYNEVPLHMGSEYVGDQQKEDALIDLLILSKASLIYTNGSYFADMARFLNPKIKIVSLDGREAYYKGILNYLPKKEIIYKSNTTSP